jgi:MFS family permease
MKKFFGPYARFLRTPDVASSLVIAWIARLPIGMTALAMLLFLRESLGSYQAAGGLVGAYFVAMAASAPVQGRIIDRSGPYRVILVTGVLQPLLVLGVFAAALMHLPYSALFALAVLAGLFPPPVTVLTRTLWRHRFSDDGDRRMAFSVDAVFVELNFTVGPSLVAGLVAVGGTKVAYLATTAVMFASPWIFLKTPAMKYWKQEPPAERHLLGPLTDLRLTAVFLITFGLTFCFGLLEVGYPAYATSLALPALGGVLLTVNSVGSAAGGALYGGIHLKMSMERQFAVLMAIMALPLALHAVIDQQILFGVVAFLAGASIAPAIAAQNLLVARMAPAKYATEAFTWSTTFIVCGLGAGMAVGGAMAEQVSVKSPFVLGSVVTILMALGALGIKPRRHE